MKFRKKVSKRMSCKRKYKIQKKVREHKRKLKKEARKNKHQKVKVKDPGIPNSLPFKDKVLQEVEECKKAKQLAILQKKKSFLQPKQELVDFQNEAPKKATEFESMMDVESTTDQTTQNEKKIQTQNKAFKEFYQVVESADVILHVLDARDPLNTRCTQVEQAVINSGTNKRIILVLNKIDLIPHQNLLLWLKYLRNEFPTVAFKASTQDQRDNLSQCHKDIKHCSERLLQSSKCIGADMLMKLLNSYCFKDENFKKEDKTSICVGVVGFPNVGKSSLINSLKRSKACNVGCYPGVTRISEEVHLTKNIKLIDCPGVVHSKPDSSDIAYVSICRVEDLKDPELTAISLLKRINCEQLMLEYRLPEFSSPDEFLILLSKRLGRLKKGGIPDVRSAARKFLTDWNRGKIKYFTHPPIKHQFPSHISSEIVETMGKGFDLSLLENDANGMDISTVLSTDAIDVTEKENCEDITGEDVKISLVTDKRKKSATSNEDDDESLETAKRLKHSMKKQRKQELKRLRKKRKKQEKTSIQLSESLVAALATFNEGP